MALVTLDDDLLAKYTLHAEAATQPVAVIIERQLARFVDFPPSQRVVPLTREPLHQLEQLLGGGSLTSPQQLVDRVRAYSSVKLGGIDLQLSPGQKAEIAHRADKQGKSPEAIMQDLVDQLTGSLFWETIPTR